MEQSFGLFCSVLCFPGLTETFHEPVFIYPLSPDYAPAKITHKKWDLCRSTGRNTISGHPGKHVCLRRMVPRVNLCLQSTFFFLFCFFVALQIWGRKRLKTWVHSPTRYKVKSNRFHDSKNDVPVCIRAVQVSSKPVCVSTWIRIMEWLCQY